MSNIVSNTASTHIQNLLALALNNAILQKKPALFGIFLRGGTFGRFKRYNWAFCPNRPARESPGTWNKLYKFLIQPHANQRHHVIGLTVRCEFAMWLGKWNAQVVDNYNKRTTKEVKTGTDNSKHD